LSWDEPQRYLAGILRYFASAAVGVAVVWLFTDQHQEIKNTLLTIWPQDSAWSNWVFVGVLAVVGLLSYFVHRTAFHWWVNWGILKFIHRRQSPVSSSMDLDFARWQRRGSENAKAARSVQSALDEVNASAHFLYCSAWASLLIALFLYRADISNLHFKKGMGWVVGALLLLGLIGDVRAARYDIEASKKFPTTTT
jgi:hypothetical protein